MIDNTRQIVKELILKTDSREIKWFSTFENSDKVIFCYIKNITEKKRLIFEVILRRDKFLSEINIKFGPIGYTKDNTYISTQFITNINIKKQPLLYDLLDSLQIKYNNGDIHNIDNINRERKKEINENPILQIAKQQNKPYDQITGLNCSFKNLTNLDGIENLINLKELYCSGNQLTNLNGIENLINLERLYCNNNQLTNLNGLENLINLKYLSCSGNRLTNLNGIENLINLKTLYCIYNNFSNDYKKYLKEYCKKKNIDLII